MGNFRIVVEAVGGHGCQREVKDGGKVFGCRRMDCPDCLTQEFVEKMNKIAPVSKAELIHWPETAGSVTDEIVVTKYSTFSYKNTGDTEEKHGVTFDPGHRIRHGNF